MGLSVTKQRLRCKTGRRGLCPCPGLAVQLVSVSIVPFASRCPCPCGCCVLGRCRTRHIGWIRSSGIDADGKTPGCRPITGAISLLDIQDMGFTVTECNLRCKGGICRLNPGSRFAIQLVSKSAVAATAGCPGPGGCRVVGKDLSTDIRRIRTGDIDGYCEAARSGPVTRIISLLDI